MKPTPRLFDYDPDTRRYTCAVCKKAIAPRPVAARVSHAKSHLRKREAFARWNKWSHSDDYFVGPDPGAKL